MFIYSFIMYQWILCITTKGSLNYIYSEMRKYIEMSLTCITEYNNLTESNYIFIYMLPHTTLSFILGVNLKQILFL